MPYISKEDLEQARRIDLLTYLKACEPDELVSMGHEKYKLKSHDSLKLSNGKWFWWSHNIGGSTGLSDSGKRDCPAASRTSFEQRMRLFFVQGAVA